MRFSKKMIRGRAKRKYNVHEKKNSSRAFHYLIVYLNFIYVFFFSYADRLDS